MLLGAIEGGGTRFRCAVGDQAGVPRDVFEVATRGPAETLAQVIGYFSSHGVEALGLACFGPLGLDPELPGYGSLLATPKAGWSGFDLVGRLCAELDVPLAFDTDVNGAALGEAWRGAAQGCGDVVYVTVGTGVGFGVLAGGRPVHGALHPEAGHLRVRRDPKDNFEGSCPFHGDCLEGLISGPALAARSGGDPKDLGEEHPLWTRVVAELAEGLSAAALLCAPERIVLGGGVGQRTHLMEPLRKALGSCLGGYLPEDRFGAMPDWLVPAGLGAEAGLVGALKLAVEARS